MRKLAPKLEEWLQGFNALLEKLSDDGFVPTSTNAREGLANLTYTLVSKKPVVEWVHDDLVLSDHFSVPIRVYHPQPEESLPLLLYFHGGGHMAGSITVYDSICRKLARNTKHVVIAVDYRLAPECPYPQGINDALLVVRNISITMDRIGVNYRNRLSIAGDSAGGAICATLSHLMQHDAQISIDKQVLIYPSLDYTMSHASIEENGKGYLLEREKIGWYFDNYFQRDEDRRTASPLFMEFTTKLPDSLIITTEFCPLRDEGYEYCKKLNDAGVVFRNLHFDDMIHAFMNMEDLVKKQCDQLYGGIEAFLNAK